MFSDYETTLNITKKIKLFTIILFSVLLLQFIYSNKVQASYDGGRLIDDTVFLDARSMSVSQIQAFLNDRGGQLASKKFVMNCDAAGQQAKQAYVSLGAPCGNSIASANIIYYVAQVYGINPKVIIATMQKEQSLITAVNPTARQYSQAMGYACPTSGNCSDSSNFFWQVDNGTWVLRFHYERARGNMSWWYNSSSWVCGVEKAYYKPNLYPGQNVRFYDQNGVHYRTHYIKNAATSAMYCYTPHVYNNPQGLYGRAPYGTTGMYYSGSYNFVIFYEMWFGTTLSSPLFKVNGSNTYYLSWNSIYYPIPSTDVLYAYGLARYAPRVIGTLPSGETQGPILSRGAKFGSDNPNSTQYTATVNVVDGGKYHEAPNWLTLNNHGFASYTSYDQSLRWLLAKGDPLRPVVRKPNGAIYVMVDNIKYGFPNWQTFSSLSGKNYAGSVQKYSEQSLSNMSSQYIDSKVSGIPMLLDGTFIGSNDTNSIYLYDNGKLLPFSPSAYGSWGKKIDFKFSKSILDKIPKGVAVKTLVKSTGGKYYMADGGRKLLINTSTLQSWGLQDSDFTLMTDKALGRLSSGNLGTLVQPRGSAGVFFIDGGHKHGITSLDTFNKLGFSWSNVMQLDSNNISLIPRGADNIYPDGSLIRKPNGAVYMLDGNDKAYGVTSLSLFNNFGFSWSNVSNVSENFLSSYSLSHLETLIKDASSNQYYIVQKGKKYSLSSSTMGTSQYNFASHPYSVLHTRPIEKIKTGQSMTRFIRGDGPTVYYIENGKKQGITSASKFFGLGGSWDKVISVSDSFLSEIPSGPII